MFYYSAIVARILLQQSQKRLPQSLRCGFRFSAFGFQKSQTEACPKTENLKPKTPNVDTYTYLVSPVQPLRPSPGYRHCPHRYPGELPV
jgi:hypothetical protein